MDDGICYLWEDSGKAGRYRSLSPGYIVYHKNRHLMMSFIKEKLGCYIGHTAKGYILRVRQGAFPKEVTIKSKSD